MSAASSYAVHENENGIGIKRPLGVQQSIEEFEVRGLFAKVEAMLGSLAVPNDRPSYDAPRLSDQIISQKLRYAALNSRHPHNVVKANPTCGDARHIVLCPTINHVDLRKNDMTDCARYISWKSNSQLSRSRFALVTLMLVSASCASIFESDVEELLETRRMSD